MVYDVRVLAGWFDPDDENTSGDDEGDAAASGADDDGEEDGEEEVMEVEVEQEPGKGRGMAAGRARPEATGRGGSRAGGSATHEPARAGNSRGGSSSSGRACGGGDESETRRRRLTETLSMDAVDAEARANASRVALALEGLISGLGAGANKQARVLTGEACTWIDRAKVPWRGNDDKKRDTPPPRGTAPPLHRASNMPVKPSYRSEAVGSLPSKPVSSSLSFEPDLVELKPKPQRANDVDTEPKQHQPRSEPQPTTSSSSSIRSNSGVELLLSTCSGFKTRIDAAVDAGDEVALRGILDTLSLAYVPRWQNLKESMLARVVKKKLQAHGNAEIAAPAAKLIEAWLAGHKAWQALKQAGQSAA